MIIPTLVSVRKNSSPHDAIRARYVAVHHPDIMSGVLDVTVG